jgi:hypothetical protein
MTIVADAGNQGPSFNLIGGYAGDPTDAMREHPHYGSGLGKFASIWLSAYLAYRMLRKTA